MYWLTEQLVIKLFEKWHGSSPDGITPLPPSGSSRQYFRVTADNQSFIAAFNTDVRENKAFIAMTRHFTHLDFPVPEILAVDDDMHCYLISDLGDTTLFSLLPKNHTGRHFDQHTTSLYKKAVDWLAIFQTEGSKGLDFSICYPRQAFDRHSMMWDLNYFKYYFLKTSGIAFDEQKLEDSFDTFTKHLLKQDSDFFMYRDFQSRNIMVLDNQTYFIDYQGGRKGALPYDIASILFDAKANLPFDLRLQLLDHYIQAASRHTRLDEAAFRAAYYDFVLIRVMQAIATYGFRGGVENKPLFLQSMPFALNNLRWLAENELLPKYEPYLCGLIEQIAATAPVIEDKTSQEGLTVFVKSFSYRQGIPADYTGNGGGFVFDCRVLPNPGRQDSFKMLTGKDEKVAAYLNKTQEVTAFMEMSSAMIANAIENYLGRGHESLMVSFGCTGGQHRSVYCAEKLAKMIQKAYPVNLELQHMEESKWPDVG